jgi:uncharacterized membrane protein
MALRNKASLSSYCVIIFRKKFLPRFTQRRRNLCAHPLLITRIFLCTPAPGKLQSGTPTTHYAAMIILLFLCNNGERESQVPLRFVMEDVLFLFVIDGTRIRQKAIGRVRVEFCQ